MPAVIDEEQEKAFQKAGKLPKPAQTAAPDNSAKEVIEALSKNVADVLSALASLSADQRSSVMESAKRSNTQTEALLAAVQAMRAAQKVETKPRVGEKWIAEVTKRDAYRDVQTIVFKLVDAPNS